MLISYDHTARYKCPIKKKQSNYGLTKNLKFWIFKVEMIFFVEEAGDCIEIK